MKSIYQILEEIFKIKEATLPKSIKANGLGGTLEDMAEYLDGIDSRLSKIPASSGQNVKKITVRDLTSLTDVNPDDLYLVFSSGNDTDGWSEKNTFTLYNETYQDGTYFQWFNSKWTAVSRDEVNIENVAKFEPLQNNVALISETFPLSSYWNLEGMEQGGLRIATVDCYELDESSKSYKPKTQSANGKSTNKKTLFVPYAKKHKQGGEDKFEGGLLTAADYKWLSGVFEEVEELVSKLPKFTIKVVDELPTEDISDTTVYLLPSTSAISGNLYDEYIYVNNKWEHLGSQSIDLKDYAKKSDIPTKLGDLENDANYATQTWVNSQGYLKAVPSTYALKTEIPTKLSQLSNDASYATEEWVRNQDYTKNTGTVTSVAVKMNGTTKGTVTSSGTIDLGTVLTSHQSLADYAKKTDIPTVPTKVSEFTNDAGYLTKHQSLANFVTTSTLTTELAKKMDARPRWKVVQQSVGAVGFQEIATIKQTNLNQHTDYMFVIRITGLHNTARFSDTLLITGTHSGNGKFSTPALFEWLEGSSYEHIARVYANASDAGSIRLAISRSSQWAVFNCEVLEMLGSGVSVTGIAEGTTHPSTDTSHLKQATSNVATQTKSMKVVYEDGTEETLNILYK